MTQFIDRDELKSLWRVLERLQADVVRKDGKGWNWNAGEIEALVIVMDAVKDTYSLTPLDIDALDDNPTDT